MQQVAQAPRGRSPFTQGVATHTGPGTIDTQALFLRSNPPANMSLAEAAMYLGVSEKTVWRETVARHIKVARIGRRLIYRRVDLDRYVELRVAAS